MARKSSKEVRSDSSKYKKKSLTQRKDKNPAFVVRMLKELKVKK